MNIYESLGIRPVINAQATLTRLGGSLMPPEVIKAMNDAARFFIDLDELQQRVSERIAELTHNEAAYVSSGAAAGLLLAASACITGHDANLKHVFPHLDDLKNEIIVQKSHRGKLQLWILVKLTHHKRTRIPGTDHQHLAFPVQVAAGQQFL